MTLKTAIEQAQQAAYWMEAAADEDFQKRTNPKKRRDGSIEWKNAAYNLSILTGVQVSGEEVKMAYYSK